MELLYLEIFLADVYSEWSFPNGSVGKDCDFHAGDAGDMSLTPGSGRSPEGGHGNSTPLFLPGESHGKRSLVGYSPSGCKKSDTAEATEHAHMHIQNIVKNLDAFIYHIPWENINDAKWMEHEWRNHELSWEIQRPSPLWKIESICFALISVLAVLEGPYQGGKKISYVDTIAYILKNIFNF